MAADNTVRVDVILDSKTKGIEKGAQRTADLRKENEKLSKVFQQVEKDARSLDDRIGALTAHRFKLAKQLSENDDIELRKEFNRTNQRLGFYKKLASAVAGGASGGVDALTKLSSQRIGNPTFGTVAAAAPIALAAAPPVGAIVSGALGGSAIGLAMAGGIAAASQDERVRSAASDFGDAISREFFASGEAFVDPIRRSLDILEGDFQDLNLGETFAKAAPYVETVAAGIGRLAKNFMPGFNRALDRAGVFSETFADGLAGMGTALGDFIDNVSASPGAVEGLETGFRLLNGTVIVLGRSLHLLSDVYHFVLQANADLYGALEDVPGLGWLDGVNDIFEKILSSSTRAAVGVDTFSGVGDNAGKVQALADALGELNDEINGFFSVHGRVDDAIIAQKKAALEFSLALKENGKDWRDTTEAGLDNQTKLRDWVKAAQETRDAKVQAAGADKAAVEKANQEYDRAIEKIKEAGRQAGISETKLMDLAGEYKIEVILKTKVDAIAAATGVALEAALKNVSTNNKPREYASGGTTPAGEIYKVHKDELVWSDRQHYVSTKAQSDALMRSSPSGGMVARPLNLNGAGLGDMVFNWVVREIANRGGTLAVLGIRE